MKNMKIEVNAEQPLDEIVKELEERGCNPYWINNLSKVKFIAVKERKYTDFSYEEYCDLWCGVTKLTTLSELKEM